MKATSRLWTLGLLVGLLACGESTAPPESGVLEAVALDDPATQVAAAGWGDVFLVHHKQFGSKYYHGTLGAEIQVLVSTDGTEWVALGSPRRTSLALQDSEAEAAVHEGGEVPIGTYRRVRLVLTDAAAALAPGSVFGPTELESGGALNVAESAPVTVDLELPAPVQLGPGQRVTLVFDLNSELWVSAESVADGRADPDAIAEAVSVGLRLPEARLAVTL